MESATLHHPALPQGCFPKFCNYLVTSEYTADCCSGQRQTEPSWMPLRHLQREKRAEDPEEELWQHYSVPPSTLRTSMVPLTGCLQHYTALLATVNPQTPSNPQISPIWINLQPNILIWADLRKELHPKTTQDEQLQISWLFTLFCIQEFSAGVDNLNRSFMNKIEHEDSKNKTTRRIEILC